jgi:putative ABC transport system ATP-binding protein
MSSNLAIETEGITKVYGSGHTEVVAVRDATVHVESGQCVALLGPSGGGKSTFLTAVGLINLPTSGRIYIAGQLVVDGPHAQIDSRSFRRRYIGYVTQKANLIGFLTARENVELPMHLNGVTSKPARKRADELLDYLGVGARSHGYPPELSGGEQQRVAIARALANQPSVVLADEPTGALDGKLGRQVVELFWKVAHEQGAAVIVVTHDLRTLDVFDAVYEMEDGVIRLSPSRSAGLAVSSVPATPSEDAGPVQHQKER